MGNTSFKHIVEGTITNDTVQFVDLRGYTKCLLFLQVIKTAFATGKSLNKECLP